MFNPRIMARIPGNIMASLALASGADAGPIYFISSEVELHVVAYAFCDEPGPQPCQMEVSDTDGVELSDVTSVDESFDALARIGLNHASAAASLQAGVTSTGVVVDSDTHAGWIDHGGGVLAYADAVVSFALTFGVGSRVPYDFHIEIGGDRMEGANVTTHIVLQDVLGVSVFEVDWSPTVGVVLVSDEAGVLEPGVYSLIAATHNHSGDGNAYNEVHITSTFVPEPATACLVAAGLAAIAVASRPHGPRSRARLVAKRSGDRVGGRWTATH
jgi:hypothetical protein